MHSAGALLFPPELVLAAVPIETKVALSHPSKPRWAFPLPAFLLLSFSPGDAGWLRLSSGLSFSAHCPHLHWVVLQRSTNAGEK